MNGLWSVNQLIGYTDQNIHVDSESKTQLSSVVPLCMTVLCHMKNEISVLILNGVKTKFWQWCQCGSFSSGKEFYVGSVKTKVQRC